VENSNYFETGFISPKNIALGANSVPLGDACPYKAGNFQFAGLSLTFEHVPSFPNKIIGRSADAR
jgi:hypothetical protein